MKRFVCFLLTFLMIVSLVPATVLTASAASSLKTSEQGIAIIKKFEGFQATPYQHGTQWYVGYGTEISDKTLYEGGITESEATELLRNHLHKKDGVDDLINQFAARNNLVFTQNQHDALASFTYNCGTGWLTDSTSVFRKAVLSGKKGNEFLNAICLWNGGSSSSVYFKGLMERRLAEANMYLNNVYSSSAPASYTYVILKKGEDTAVVQDAAGNDLTVYAYITSTSPSLSIFKVENGSKKFLGWYDKDNKPVSVLDKSTAKATLTAKWQDGAAAESAKYTINSSESASRNVYKSAVMDKDSKKGTLKANSSFKVTKEKIVGNETTGIIKWIYGKGVDTDGKTIEGWVPYKNMEEVDLSSEKVLATATVTKANTPVFEGASESGTELGKLPQGYIAKILAFKNEYTASGTKSWGKIAYSGGYGWINLAYADLRDATASDNTSLVGKTAKVVNANKVNIRADAGTGHEKIGSIAKDTKVTIIETKQVAPTAGLATGSTWAKIRWNNDLNQGWIYMYYLQVAGESSGGSTTQDVAIYTGVVNSNINLNVRSKPNVGATLVGSLPRGTKINIYEKATTDGVQWGRIDKNRWVCLLYVNLTAVSNSNTNGSNNAVHVVVKQVGTISASTLYLRKDATNNSDILATLTKDTEVVIEETKDEVVEGNGITKKWGKVTVDGKTGYINLAYVDIKEVSENIPDKPAKPETGVYGRVVNCINLNVRSAAGVRNALVTTIPADTLVTVYEQTQVDGATWGRIKDGWVSMSYVEITGNTGSEGSGDNSSSGTTTFTGTVNSNIDLNVRSGAGLSYGKIGSLKKGTKVTVDKQKVSDGMTWGRIKYNGINAWVCMSYLTIESTSSSGSNSGVSVMGTIARCFSAVNVRSAAGVGNALVGTIPVGSRVQVFEKTMVNGEYWARVSNGWICMQYVILDEELPAPTEPTTPSTTPTEGTVDSDKENSNVAVNYSFRATVAEDTKVYKEATEASNETGKFNQDSSVTILSLKRSVDGKELWGYVNDFGIPGWVQMKNVTFTINGYVQTDGLKVYAAADAASENIGSMKINDEVSAQEIGLSGSTVFGKVTVVDGESESYIGWIDLSKVGDEKVVLTPQVNATTGTGIINAKTTEKTPAYTTVKAETVAYNVIKNTTVNVKSLIADHGILWGEISADVKGESVTAYIELNKLIYVCNVTCTANTDAKAYSNYGAGETDTPKNIDADGNVTVITEALKFTSFAVDTNGHVWGQIQGTTDYNGAWIALENTSWPDPS